MRWGVGTGASRLACGTMTVHRRLEERLAAFSGTQAALLFGSGYLARFGTIPALAREGDVVFCDELNHAALLDGCRLAGAQAVLYHHNDVEHLAWVAERSGTRSGVVVTESVFATDGDLAPLGDLVDLADRMDLRLVVDESHVIGTVGHAGRGAVAEAGLECEIDVVIGTLGGALGSYGAYVACDSQTARSLAPGRLLYSTAPPPPVVAAALAALELMIEQPRRIDKLHANARVHCETVGPRGLRRRRNRDADRPGHRRRRRHRAAHVRLRARGRRVLAGHPPAGRPRRHGALRLAVMASHTPRPSCATPPASSRPRRARASAPAPGCRSPPRRSPTVGRLPAAQAA